MSLKDLGPISYEDLLELFPNAIPFNKNYLLLMKFRKILESKTIAQIIIAENKNIAIKFDEQDLLMVLEDKIHFNNYSKKDLLNILINCNHELLDMVLDDDKTFNKIQIICNEKDYNSEYLNISLNSEFRFQILKRNDLLPQLCIKQLANCNGEICLENLEYLDKCISLFGEEKVACIKGFKFIINLEKSDIDKIMKIFNLRKYIHLFPNEMKGISFKQIENLIYIQGNFIDRNIFNIIFNNYYFLVDENEKWLKTIFTENDICYSNLDVALWIMMNDKIYNEKYLNLKEIHMFAEHDEQIFSLFCQNQFFIEKLVHPQTLIHFLFENYDEDIMSKNLVIGGEFLKCALKNYNEDSFKDFLKYSEHLFAVVNAFKTKMLSDFDTTAHITLELENTTIETSIKELLESEALDDLKDFNVKFEEGKIRIDEVLTLNLKKKDEILKKKLSKFNFHVPQCCICFQTECDIFIFQECGHFICWNCLLNYLSNTLNIKPLKTKKDGNGNRFISLQNDLSKVVPCPNCKKNVEKNKEIGLLKLYK